MDVKISFISWTLFLVDLMAFCLKRPCKQKSRKRKKGKSKKLKEKEKKQKKTMGNAERERGKKIKTNERNKYLKKLWTFPNSTCKGIIITKQNAPIAPAQLSKEFK